MRSNEQCRRDGKTVFQTNYWTCVAASFIVLLITGVVAAISSDKDEQWKLSIWLVRAVVGGPLAVGLRWVYLKLRRRQGAQLSDLFRKGFGANAGRHIGAYLLVTLFTALWSLLLVIPGIVKAFAYSMTMYIIADEPGLPVLEAIGKSQAMMMGRKGKLLGLYLSFLGWYILSGLTAGILGVFYVFPWQDATLAEFYEDARTDYYLRHPQQ